MRCIYCSQRQADAREHPLPQFLGGFGNYEPLVGRICQPCNQDIGRVETQFARFSPLAVRRKMQWVTRGGKQKKDPPSPFVPQTAGGEQLYFCNRDPDSGYTIFWQPDTEAGTVKPVSQFVILDEGGSQIGLLPIPAQISAGRELAELFREQGVTLPIAGLYVMAATGDDKRIEGLLSDYGRKVELTRGNPGPVPGPQLFVGRITPSYFRALAKIGFHYALKNVPTIVGNEPEFGAVREFIRSGSGEAGQFFRSLDRPPHTGKVVGHLLAVTAVPGDIVVNMWLFWGFEISLPQWSLRIPKPTTPIVSQSVAHHFPYITAEDGSMKGGVVVELADA